MNGLEINTEERLIPLETVTTSFIRQKLNINTKPKNANKIGRKTYMIELNNTGDKREVMQNKAKLKQTIDARVYINDDLTKYEREKQKIIRLKAKKRKRQRKDCKNRIQ